MARSWKALLAAVLLVPALASAGLAPRAADEAAVRDDLARILAKAGLPTSLIQFHVSRGAGKDGSVSVSCDSGNALLELQAPAEEWAPTLYLGLQKLGFLFPHPRIQLSPS